MRPARGLDDSSIPAKGAVAAGLDTPVMGGDGITDDALLAAAGTAVEHTIASTPGAPLEGRTTAAAFLAAYRQAGYAEGPSDYGPEAYDATNAIIRTLARALRAPLARTARTAVEPSAARAAVVTALGATNFEGASGQVGFDAFGDTLDPTFTVFDIIDGAWVRASWL